MLCSCFIVELLKQVQDSQGRLASQRNVIQSQWKCIQQATTGIAETTSAGQRIHQRRTTLGFRKTDWDRQINMFRVSRKGGRESFSENASSMWLVVARKRLPTPFATRVTKLSPLTYCFADP